MNEGTRTTGSVWYPLHPLHSSLRYGTRTSSVSQTPHPSIVTRADVSFTHRLASQLFVDSIFSGSEFDIAFGGADYWGDVLASPTPTDTSSSSQYFLFPVTPPICPSTPPQCPSTPLSVFPQTFVSPQPRSTASHPYCISWFTPGVSPIVPEPFLVPARPRQQVKIPPQKGKQMYPCLEVGCSKMCDTARALKIVSLRFRRYKMQT